MTPALEAPLRRLSAAACIDLAAYRTDHVEERVRRALAREGAKDLSELTTLVRVDEDARNRFRRSIAVSVTGSFRDPAQYELLERTILPELAEANRTISVWSAGCSDGSELYSVAVVLDRLGLLERAFLLGSDLLEQNVLRARSGVYGEVEADEAIRQRLRFEQRDLLADGPPPGRWRLIVCRNVAIYLAPAAKAQLHSMLASSLASGGVILVGRSERIPEAAELGLRRVGPHTYSTTA